MITLIKFVKALFTELFGSNFKDEARSVFHKQIYNPNIRNNVQTSESPRDAAILVVQDALEIAGAGKVVGKITDVSTRHGMYIVSYEILGHVGEISYMPLTFRGGNAY